MSDEAENQAPTQDEYPSPLRSLITELHEVYQELRSVGFTTQTAERIVASILFDAMLSRPMNEDDEDFDEEEDDNDIGV